MRSALTDLVRHDAWATLLLIDFVRGLTTAQRLWSVSGTYGSIEQTLAHLVGSEAYYVFRLTGKKAPGGADEGAAVDLDALASRLRWCAAELERVCEAGFDADAPTHPNPNDDREPRLGGMLVQLIQHANEHRTHVATTLGSHGIEPPSISGWDYAGRPTS